VHGSTVTTPGCTPVDLGPMTALTVVMRPKYVTERQYVSSTEYRDEESVRAVTSYRLVPVEEERFRVNTVMVSKTETKTVEYTVTTPVRSEKTATYQIKVPVWSDVEEKYMVKVPVIKEVVENYSVQVPVLKDEPFQYTVNVPYPVTRTVQRTVTNVVPVKKTRTYTQSVPVTRTSVKDVDYGHWESQVVTVATSSGCGSRRARRGCGGCGDCGGCGGCVGYTTVCQKVWVPNIRTEEVSEVAYDTHSVDVEYVVYEQHHETVPYECVSICYQPEVRQGVRKVVAYETQTKQRPRRVVEYTDAPRTRTKKVLTFKEETVTETYPVITHKQEKKMKEVSYTVTVPETQVEKYTVVRHDQVQEVALEKYLTKVAVPVVREVEVQVCKMVPEIVEVSYNPCATAVYGGDCGCGCGRPGRCR
jgi:hypothetical protein